MGRPESQCGGNSAARLRNTPRLRSLFLVISLALILIVTMFASNYSISSGYNAPRYTSMEKNGHWEQQLVNSNAGAAGIIATNIDLDGGTGFDESLSVAGCADNRAQRFGCLV